MSLIVPSRILLSPDAARVLDAVRAEARHSRNAKTVAAALGVNPSSLGAALWRAYLPSVKHMLDAATAVYLAEAVLATGGRVNFARLAHDFGFTQGGHFNRWCRRILGHTACGLLAGLTVEEAETRYWIPLFAGDPTPWRTLTLPPRRAVAA